MTVPIGDALETAKNRIAQLEAERKIVSASMKALEVELLRAAEFAVEQGRAAWKAETVIQQQRTALRQVWKALKMAQTSLTNTATFDQTAPARWMAARAIAVSDVDQAIATLDTVLPVQGTWYVSDGFAGLPYAEQLSNIPRTGSLEARIAQLEAFRTAISVTLGLSGPDDGHLEIAQVTWLLERVKELEAALAAEREKRTEAELAREASLRQVLIDLVKALHACKSSIDAAFLMQYVHGARHTGPTYGKELARAEEVLKGEAREDAD